MSSRVLWRCARPIRTRPSFFSERFVEIFCRSRVEALTPDTDRSDTSSVYRRHACVRVNGENRRTCRMRRHGSASTLVPSRAGCRGHGVQADKSACALVTATILLETPIRDHLGKALLAADKLAGPFSPSFPAVEQV